MFDNLNRFFKKFQTNKKIDDVCSLERLGRDEYKYIEGERALKVQIEMLSGTPKRLIYSRTIKSWLPPHEHETISEEKRTEIIGKICKYFEINDLSYTVK